MKISIDTGAYGWRKKIWTSTFYPEDLPAGDTEDDAEDWRLAYYANYFNVVMLPAGYWSDNAMADCENWLEDVHADFHFFIEYRQDMPDFVSVDNLSRFLQKWQSRLSALVLLPDEQSPGVSELQYGANWKNNPLNQLLGDLCPEYSPGIYIDETERLQELTIYWSKQVVKKRANSQWFLQNLVFMKDDLTDLRRVRRKVETVLEQIENGGVQQEHDNHKLTIIVDHPRLQAGDLRRFRSLLEIMGY